MGIVIITPAITDFRGKYRWLSNYHLCNIRFEGLVYPSTEHAYQAAKSLDMETRREFLGLSCKAARLKGQAIELRADWPFVKLQVMHQVNWEKYFWHLDLRKFLLDTGDAELIEGNSWKDSFFGVDSKTGIGENHLGKILMQIRKELSL